MILDATQQTHWAAVVVILAAWAVYAPAMNRVFVVDQIWYMAEMNGNTSLTAGLHHYDYAATRRYWKGDDALFRPVLFTWLAIANSLFTYHHVWWNLGNLALHVLVGLCMFRLFMTIRPSLFALPGAVYFTIAKPNLELVLWNHLGGYLLACAFFLVAVRIFADKMLQPDRPRSPLLDVAYVAAFTAASLSHESMAPASIVAGILLILAQTKKHRRLAVRDILAAGAPLLIFSIVYAFHLNRVERPTYVDRPDVHSMLEASNVQSAAGKSLQAISGWAKEAAIPSALHITAAPYTRAGKEFVFSRRSRRDVLNVAILTAILALIASHTSIRHIKRVLAVLALLIGTMFAFAAVICLGRPYSEVISIAYYLYFPTLLLVAIAYVVVDFDRVRWWTASAGYVLMTLLVLLHGAETSAAASAFGVTNGPASAYLRQIERFVDNHKAETDFSFVIQNPMATLDPAIPLLEGYPDQPAAAVQSRRVTEILFARFYRIDQPKYVFDPHLAAYN